MVLNEWLRRFAFLLRRNASFHDLHDEMQFHRELRERQLVLDGLEADAARAAASRQFGNQTGWEERSKDMWGWRWVEDFGKDLRQAGRMLAGNKAFAIVAILTLALGIGANTAIFSVTDAVLLRLLPVSHAKQIYRIECDRMPNRAGNTGNAKTSFSDYVFEQLRGRHDALSDLMAYVPMSFQKFSARAGKLPEEVAGDMVSGNFFSGLGVSPVCGRVLTPQDESTHAAVAVISYSYWMRRFAGTCAAVGKSIDIRGVPFTIVGVAPKRFTGLEADERDLWIPLQLRPEFNAWGIAGDSYAVRPSWWCILMAGRLKPSVSKAGAEAALNPAFQRAAYEPFGGKPERGEHPVHLHLVPARGIAGGEGARQQVVVLQAMVGLILLLACVNVSTLLGVRNAARGREFSVRLALGGSRSRLFRQLLTETLVIVFCGSALGFVLSLAITPVLARWAELPIDSSPDAQVLWFTAAVSAAVVLLFGSMPVRNATKVSIAESLAAEDRCGDFTRLGPAAACDTAGGVR